MHLDPALPGLSLVLLVVLSIAFALKRAKQPYVVAYIIAGVVIGPSALGLLANVATIERLGSFGIILLLFFVGMEVDPRQFIRNWKVPVLGTLFQIAASVACAAGIGWYLDWPLARTVLIGFVISLSSTAVVLKVLEDTGENRTQTGEDAVGVLLAQDILVVPMLIVIAALGDEKNAAPISLTKQLIGAVILTGLIAVVLKKKGIRLPFAKALRSDHEIQVFGALGLCLGFAMLLGFFELSAALGGFVAGLVVGAAKETSWVHHSLHPFRVLFVSLFFLSVGMLVDLTFLAKHYPSVLAVVAAALVTNTAINALVLQTLGGGWRRSLYTGAVLAQIGEFGFVLVAMGRSGGIVSVHAYQLVISSISVSLILSPIWMKLVGAWARPIRQSIVPLKPPSSRA